MRTVDDIRNDLIKRVEKGLSGDRQEIVAQLDYEVFEAIREKENLAFLAIGGPETDGCYCQVNHILKDIIASVASSFDIQGKSLLDMKAGETEASLKRALTVLLNGCWPSFQCSHSTVDK